MLRFVAVPLLELGRDRVNPLQVVRNIFFTYDCFHCRVFPLHLKINRLQLTRVLFYSIDEGNAFMKKGGGHNILCRC
jgi:hypothetical protein